MAITKSMQTKAAAHLGEPFAQQTAGGSVPNAARIRKVKSFTLGAESLDQIEKLSGIYGKNDSQIIELALQALAKQQGDGLGAAPESPVQPDETPVR